MNPCKAYVILRLTRGMKSSGFRTMRDARLMSRATARFGRFSVRFALVALAVGLFISNVLAIRVFSHSGAMMTSVESIGLFSSADLTTPKTVFNLGDKAWALDTGAPLPVAGFRQRRFQWVAPDGTVKQQSDITISGQSDSLQISMTEQVGTWQVKSVDNSNIGYAIASFVVRDPNNASTDLSVHVFGQTQAAAGKNHTYTLTVTNNGPDDAQNVHLMDVVSGDVNFQSLTEPPDWSCAGSNTITCTIARMASGATASFTLVFQIDADAPAAATISNTADITSQTNELHAPDNSSTSSATVTTAPCAFTCPDNIIQAHDPGMNGAIVNYETPTTSSGCEPVVCTPASGSFFPAGVTSVVCSSLSGGSCSFTVTVTGTMTITLDGSDPLIVECHSEFREPGATAQNDNGNTFPVTSSAQTTLDVNTPGTYTITYTATDGVNTATATRTVNVVDTTPPVISCPADTTLLADTNCQAAIPNVAAGVTASDNCTTAGSLAITQSPAAGTLVGLGATTVTVTVTDAANNSSSCETTVTVNASQLTALGAARFWVGLKNSDDVGTRFDLLAEALKNGAVVGSGQLNDAPGGSSGFNNAVLDTINLALSGPMDISSGDTLSIRLSVRVAASSSHRSGTARLWFNDDAANSGFDATFGCVTNSQFLLSGFSLDAAAGPGPKNTIDVFVDRDVGGNPFKPFGTWSKTF